MSEKLTKSQERALCCGLARGAGRRYCERMESAQLQTFLPYPSFAHSVHVLDRARLGKQRVECSQLLTTLGAGGGWERHPAASMWRGYESALGLYMTLCVREWERRGYVNNMLTPYDARWRPSADSPHRAFVVPLDELTLPPWLDDEAFHASHRSNLLRKMPQFYEQYGWTESSDLPYVWPT